LALLAEQPLYSAYSIAEAPGVSHSTILSHLRESLGMKNVHLRWIPHELTTSLRQIRMEMCRELLLILKGSREKQSSKVCDWGRELVHSGISPFYEMMLIAR
jgi:hypothetical protein